MPPKKDVEASILKVLHENKLDGEFCLDIKVVSEKEIQLINKQFRQIDKPTDVLSFPIWEKKIEKKFGAYYFFVLPLAGWVGMSI